MGVYGIAAPLLNRDRLCEASIAILVPTARAANIAEFRGSLLEVAAKISEKLASD
jgi:DNA-binding IclR family transcriptional regulator